MAALNTIAEAAIAGQDREVAALGGGIRAIDSLYRMLHPPERPDVEREEEFIDPATIRRPST